MINSETLWSVICDGCGDSLQFYDSRDEAVAGGTPWEAGMTSHFCPPCHSEAGPIDCSLGGPDS